MKELCVKLLCAMLWPKTVAPRHLRQVPRLPHRMEVDASKCHACRVHGDKWEPNAPPEPAQCHKCHACHTKCRVHLKTRPRPAFGRIGKWHAVGSFGVNSWNRVCRCALTMHGVLGLTCELQKCSCSCGNC